MPFSKFTPAEQTAYLKAMLDSTVEGYYAVDKEGRTTVCNKAFIEMLGYETFEEVLGRRLHDEIHHSHPDGTPYDISDCPIYKAATQGVGTHIPYDVFFRKDGTSFPVEYRAEPIFQDGVLKGAVCTFIDISEQVRSDAELDSMRRKAKAANDRIEVALDAGIVIGTYIWDIPQNIVRGDGRFARIFDITSDQAEKGMPIEEVVKNIHPEDIDRVRSLINKTLEEGGLYDTEYRVKQGQEWLWVQASGRVERDEQGNPTIFSGVISDIDARKFIEQNYRDTQDQLQLAQEAGGIGLFTVDIEANTIVASPEFFRIFGVDFVDITSPSVFEEIIIPEDASKRSNVVSRSDGTAALETEYRIRRPSDGEVRWISRRSTIAHDVNGKPKKMTGAVIDITENKNSAMRLEESRTQYRELFNSIDEGFCIIEMIYDNAGKAIDYRFLEVNPAFEKHTTLKDARGKTMRSFVPNHEERWFKIYGEVADTGKSVRFHQSSAALEGREFDLYAFRVGAPENKQVAVLFSDVTEQVRLQQAMEAARLAAEASNLAKTEFLANMSHEIRTPMNAIIGLSDILSKSSPLTDKQRQFISTLRTSADGLLVLINDLLDISKIEARSVELEKIPFSLSKVIHEVISMMTVRVKEKGLAFTSDGECIQDGMFIGDPTRIRQIILNLCSNAIKFTETGSIHIGVTCEPVDGSNTEMITISIEDTGIGIAPDKVEAIFQKFVQADASINRKYGGTGLGLAITKTLTEVMNGKISVESVEGKGSQFSVTIPLERMGMEECAPCATEAQASSVSPQERAKSRILLVEDYEPNVMVATILLEEFGYVVEVASNGIEAVEAVKARPFDSVLMDVQMHGMNGFDATILIREHEKRNQLSPVPIIGMTAHAMAGDRERCIAAGMDDYVSKPFNSDMLNDKIRKLIRDRNLRRAA